MVADCSHVRVEMRLEGDLLNIKGSSVHLRKTIMNLVLNAFEAQPEEGQILIRTFNRYVDKALKGYDHVMEGDYAVLEIVDQGVGIPAEDLNRIFEPFYTRKVMGRSGTGLGMAVVWGTVQDHDGYIDVESTVAREVYSASIPGHPRNPQPRGSTAADPGLHGKRRTHPGSGRRQRTA